MKIFNDRNYINRLKLTKPESRQLVSGSVKKPVKKFDEITISSKQAPDETTFARELSRKIMKETSAPTDARKLEEIKDQVQSGTYNIMIDEIAKKMLLY